jgi:ssDNA-binding Zn-finger/Zn-ribbon topoisomerase 1
MKLIKIIDQSRRDFQGEYQCEFCNHIEKDKSMDSYDDRNYHDNVIPSMECPKCGKSTISENGIIERTETKFPEWKVV